MPCPAWMRVRWAGFVPPQGYTRGRMEGITAFPILCLSGSNRTRGAPSVTTFEFTSSDPMTKSEKKNDHKRNWKKYILPFWFASGIKRHGAHSSPFFILSCVVFSCLPASCCSFSKAFSALLPMGRGQLKTDSGSRLPVS